MEFGTQTTYKPAVTNAALAMIVTSGTWVLLWRNCVTSSMIAFDATKCQAVTKIDVSLEDFPTR